MPGKTPFHYYLLWFVTLVSLSLNVIIIVFLLNVRQQAGAAFARAADAVAELKAGVIEYNISVDEELPLALDVPVKLDLAVPIDETLLINTTVNIPIELPFVGLRTFSAPISANVPLKLTIKAPIDKTIPVNATLPVQLEVPLRIRIADTPVGKSLEEVEGLLLELAQEFGAGP